jgi:radical SAM-linked protein
MRYSIKFSKESGIKFISHLDLAKTLQRIVKRSELPIMYSQGFNPHMAISIGQPLSVGMYSEGEYMDVDFEEKLSEEYIKEQLNANSPAGVKFSEVVFVLEKDNVKNPPQAMAAVEEADYEIRLKYERNKNLKEEIDKLLKESQWVTLKKSKSGEKEVDIKPLVKDFKFSILADYLFIKTTIACGSKENLSAQLLAEYIASNTTGVDREAFVDIKRKEMYAYFKKKRFPLYEFYKQKWH